MNTERTSRPTDSPVEADFRIRRLSGAGACAGFALSILLATGVLGGRVSRLWTLAWWGAWGYIVTSALWFSASVLSGAATLRDASNEADAEQRLHAAMSREFAARVVVTILAPVGSASIGVVTGAALIGLVRLLAL